MTWKSEGQRHVMSAKGIKTKFKVINPNMYPKSSYPECLICHKRMTVPVKYQIGLIMETGKLTTDPDKATQGFFPIGLDCLNKLIKGKVEYWRLVE